MTLYKELVFPVRVSDFDYNDKMTCYSILDYFQQLARIHANIMKIGYEDLLNRDLAFVIVKTKFTILNHPSTSANIMVSTYPLAPTRIDFDRVYLIKDEVTGETLVKGTSRFVLVDINTYRIQRSSILQYEGIHNDINVYSEIEKIQIPNINLKYAYTYAVKNSALDQNKHVNNAKYVQIALDALDNLDFKIKEVTINYLNQALLNDEIEIYYEKNDYDYYFIGKNNDKTFFSLKIKGDELK